MNERLFTDTQSNGEDYRSFADANADADAAGVALCIASLLHVLDRRLEGRDYICGDKFTIADMASCPWVRGWKWSKIDSTGHANVVAQVERVRGRPGVKRGLAFGAPKGQVD